MEKTFKQNGITLIALVITIIVLLILAGISIAMLTGENGILTKAADAKNKTNHETVAEGIKLEYDEYQIAKNADNYAADFLTYLKENEEGKILDTDGIIIVNNLLGQSLSTGNGTGFNDVYKLEEVIANEKYSLKYYYTKENFIELDIIGSSSASKEEVYDGILTVPTESVYSFNAGWKDGAVTSDIIAYVVETGETTEDGDPLYEMLFIGEGEMAPITEWKTEIVELVYDSWYGTSLEDILWGIDINTIKISIGITNIAERAFFKCTSLKSASISSSVTIIGDSAFFGCDSLRNIVLPSSVTTVGSNVFNSCTNLISVTIPSSVSTIENRMFNNCTNLQSVTISFGVTYIGYRAFYGCTNLTSIVIPSSVKTIDSGAFSSCTGLTSVTIEDGVTNIGNTAFMSCDGLTNVTIPSSVTSIESYAFEYCENLASVYFEHTSVPTWGSDCFYKSSGEVTTFYFKNETVAKAFTTDYYDSSYGTKSPDYDW